jgi:ribonuclease P protein component
MLPAEARMRRPAEFTLAVRRGSRSGRRTVTGHLIARDAPDEPARVGFVVSRAVGNAVTRNKVRRRLRHIARGYLDCLPRGSLLVVRANPPAAAARQSDLAAEFGLVLGNLLRRQVGALHQ